MPDTSVPSALDSEVVKTAIRLACRAPSLHNSQPWKWVADKDSLKLFLDRDRIVRSTDRAGREAIISCGAVLDHLVAAMAAAGWAAHIDRFPNANNKDHLATLTFTPMDYVTEAHAGRVDAILMRRTDRLPMTAPPAWRTVESVLRGRLSDTAVYLDVLPDSARPQLAEASALSEALRLYDTPYHAELDWWTSPFEPVDGIPYSSLISAEESDRVDVGRNFPVTGRSRRRVGIDGDHAAVLVLSTDGDTAEDALAAGEALSRVLLDCTLAGLATCPLTHLTELPASRALIATLAGRDDLPQLLIRVGAAPVLDEVPPPTPRRPLDDVLTFR
jgi:hypothetical protein